MLVAAAPLAAGAELRAGPDARESYERLRKAAGDPGLSDEELDSELLERVAELWPEADGYGAVLRFAAELLLAVHEGRTDDPELGRLLASIPDETYRTGTIWELADARIRAGRLADAEALARFGLERHEPVPSLAPHLWHVRAEVARLRGDFGLAEACLDGMEQSIPLEPSHAGKPDAAGLVARNHESRSRLLQARTQILLEFGLPDLSRELARAALEEAEASGEERALLAARLLAIDCALVNGDAADEAVEIARGARDDPRLARERPLFLFAEGMAEIARAREALTAGKEPGQAAGRARAALAAALAAELPPTQRLQAALGLGDLARFLGEPDEARTQLERARTIAAELGAEGGPASEWVQLAVLDWRLAREGGADAERLAAARTALFAAYRRFLDSWASTPQRAGGIGFLHLASRAQLVSEVVEAELCAEPAFTAQERAFARVLEAQALGTRARGSASGPARLDELRSALLSRGQGMLVLVPARDRSHLFLVEPPGEKRAGVVHRRLAAGRVELRAKARKITSALQDRKRGVSPEELRTLCEALLPEDVQEHLATWSGVVTVGFELLRGVPFGVLAGKDGVPLARKLALASLPSVPFGLELARRARRPAPGGQDLVLVVANAPPPELSLEPFRFGEPERRRLLGPFGGNATLLDGDRATREELLGQRALLSGARILHFLAHGIELPRREYSAALVVAPVEGAPCYLTAEDVAALEPGGLVILSACKTGSGPIRTGDDCLVHLGGAFLDAGARCVILSRFPVETEATLALMERVHARLAEGDPPAEALRAAFAGAGPGDALAAYDATAFEVLGLGFEPVCERAR